MERNNKQKRSVIYRALRRVWRVFVPVLSYEERQKRDRQRDYEYLISCGVETEPGFVTLYGMPIINKHPQARIVLGNGVTIISDSKYNDAGINHPAILAATQPGAEIILHYGVGLSGTSIVAEKRIEIGANTMLGANTNIYDNDFHAVNAEDRLAGKKGLCAPIKIGGKCWFASNVTVLKGVTVGDEVVVGAMSLVTKDIPKRVFAAGVPAKVIKRLE